jgi:tetratricopeptide (TPR) repeat protein
MLDDAIAEGWATARREQPEPTVGYFRHLLVRFPDAPATLFAYASALDFAGHEADAVVAYERAFDAGLAGDELRRGLLQYGSTLRNLERYEEAVAALERADEMFPGHDSVRVYLALARLSAGRGGDAVAGLITLALDRIDSEDLQRYRWALRHYAEELRTAPPSRTT